MEEIFNKRGGAAGIRNLRELGGIPLAGGGAVRHGLLYRAAVLSPLTEHDLKRLAGFGLSAVFDFRSEYETGALPDTPVPGARYVPLPVQPLNANLYKGMAPRIGDTMSPAEKLARFMLSPAAEMLCDGFYISFIDDEDCRSMFSRFLQEAASAPGAILWHCSQGKDRTGLAAAFLLSILGASREDIMADYMLSAVTFGAEEEAIGGVCRHIAASEGLDPSTALRNAKTLISVNPQEFEAGLDRIDNHYGGMEAYVKDRLGIGEDIRAALVEKYAVRP